MGYVLSPRPKGDAVGLIVTDQTARRAESAEAGITMYLALRDEGNFPNLQMVVFTLGSRSRMRIERRADFGNGCCWKEQCLLAQTAVYIVWILMFGERLPVTRIRGCVLADSALKSNLYVGTWDRIYLD